MNYQEKVKTRKDIRRLYKSVVENENIKYYRGYTDENSYGWDEEAEDYVKRGGEHWFKNPSYDFEAEEILLGFENALKDMTKHFDLLYRMYLKEKKKGTVGKDGNLDL